MLLLVVIVVVLRSYCRWLLLLLLFNRLKSLDILVVLIVEEVCILVLIHVRLRRSVPNLKILHLLLEFELFGFPNLLLLRLLFRHLFGRLNLTEFFKDVLVVQQSVRKLFLEYIRFQETGDPHLNAGNFE